MRSIPKLVPVLVVVWLITVWYWALNPTVDHVPLIVPDPGQVSVAYRCPAAFKAFRHVERLEPPPDFPLRREPCERFRLAHQVLTIADTGGGLAAITLWMWWVRRTRRTFSDATVLAAAQ